MKLYLLKHRVLRIDGFLLISLSTAIIFCLYGINTPIDHPDQIAFQPLFIDGKAPFNPGWFHKPPFHTYFNYFLSVLPFEIIGGLFNFHSSSSQYVRLIWSRCLTIFLYLLSIFLVFQITKKTFGYFSARIIALILATSAGFVAFAHYLTADIPVMVWMVVAFYFAHNILIERNLPNYILAGFFTGIATATKYNGLAIGSTIVVVHLLSCDFNFKQVASWRKLIFSKELLLGLTMVLVGFILGNPFSILDYYTFKSDFLYNYKVTPVYDGQSGHSYLSFFWCVIELVGLPSFLIFMTAVLCSTKIMFIDSKVESSLKTKTLILSLSIILLYYYKLGSFPRIEARFILPIVPFFLIASGCFWHQLRLNKVIVALLVLLIISYNSVCSTLVGTRFLDNSRIQAKEWAEQYISKNSSVEVDVYSTLTDQQNLKLTEISSPNVSGRNRIFDQIFKGEPFIVGYKEDQRREDEMVNWYSLFELSKRQPDFISVNSLFYNRFMEPGLKRDLYPSMYQ